MAAKLPTPANIVGAGEKTPPTELGAGVAAHVGYQQDEIPTYQQCACGQLVRVDRLDLVAEHRDVCSYELLNRLRW